MRNAIKVLLSPIILFASQAYAQNGEVNYWYTDPRDVTYVSEAAPECCAPPACGAFSVGAEWLYWKIEQEQMEFGANVTVTPGDSVTSVNSEVLRPKYKQHNGYRVYADYITPCKDWRILASYTHTPFGASISVSDNPSDITLDFIQLFNTNFPILSAIASTQFDSVDGRWSGNLNYLDVDVARTFCLNNSLLIRPHLGLRGFWSEQKFVIDGTATSLSFVSHLKERLKGIGVEGGLWGDLALGSGFSLVAHVGGGLIYTNFHNSGSLDANQPDTVVHIQYKDSNHNALAMFDTFVGASWTGCLCDLLLNVHVGWEQHVVYEVNQFSVSGNGNMTMQGLTLGGGLNF